MTFYFYFSDMIHSFKQFANTLERPKPTQRAVLDLKLKTMRESFIQQFILLKSDPFTKELYISGNKQMRLSKLLENLDALAAAISYRHLDDGKIMKKDSTMSVSIVTASVDRIDLITMPTFNMDMKIHGHVSYVGHSSMEITLHIVHIQYKDGYKLPELSDFDDTSIPIYTAASPESSDILTRVYLDSGNSKIEQVNRNIAKLIPVLTAKFTMVARCVYSNLPVQVHPLKLRNEKEQVLFNKGAELRQIKKLQNQKSLLNMPPTNEELKNIHDLFIQDLSGNLLHAISRTNDANKCYMKNTILETTSVTFPQDRNVHNFIFGGYLLKSAFELAMVTAMLFAQVQLVDFMAMDDIWFRKGVPVGSILRFTSCVIYNVPPHERQTIPNKFKDAFQVQVVADVCTNNVFDTTNVFHFTFKPTEHVELRYIVPESYQESMLYLTGKRTFEQGIQHSTK